MCAQLSQIVIQETNSLSYLKKLKIDKDEMLRNANSTLQWSLNVYI